MATATTRSFVLRGADGGPLRGDVRTAGWGDARPAVIICHGFKGFKDWGFFPHLAQRVANAGLTAVTFNFSGSGVGPDGQRFTEPERFGRATFRGDLTDLAAVRDALLAGRLLDLAPPRALGVFGHSRGGGVAVLHSANDARVRALVTWNAIASVRRWSPEVMRKWDRDGKIDIVNARTGEVLPLYRDLLDEIRRHGDGELNIAAAAARIDVPWLVVHGEADESVPVRDARALCESGAAAVELETVAGGSHTFGARHPWAGMASELQIAMDRTLAWFARHLTSVA